MLIGGPNSFRSNTVRPGDVVLIEELVAGGNVDHIVLGPIKSYDDTWVYLETGEKIPIDDVSMVMMHI